MRFVELIGWGFTIPGRTGAVQGEALVYQCVQCVVFAVKTVLALLWENSYLDAKMKQVGKSKKIVQPI